MAALVAAAGTGEFGMGLINGTGGASSQFALPNNSRDGFLQGFINTSDESALRRLYKDIYENDSICGGIIDLMSMIPFSDYSLTGVSQKAVDTYMESMNRLNVRSMLPEITAEYLTFGRFIGTLIYSQLTRGFTDMMPHDQDSCTLQEMPFYSMDPVIRVRNDKKIKDFLSSDDIEVERFRRNLSPELLEAMQSEEYILDPLTAVFLERRSLMKRGSISMLRRVLPIYFLEKQLFRGTLIESSKRLKAILHMKVGNERWIPGDEELSDYLSWFQMADQDPMGAIVATRDGVSVEEVGGTPGAFWKITDEVEALTSMKMRAMGTSESFLSGDISYANAEVAVSVFMDNLKTYRDTLSYRMFTNKIFPIIAITNGLLKKDGKVTANSLNRQMQNEIKNLDKFEIPQIQWHKPLATDVDAALANLETLRGMGVPPSLRMICAAGGISVESLLSDLKEQNKLLEKFKELGYDMEDFKGGGGDFEPDEPFSPDNEDGPADENTGPVEESSSVKQILAYSFKPQNFLGRDFMSSQSEPYKIGKTGKKESIVYPHLHQSKVDGVIADAVVANMRDPQLSAKNVQKARELKIGSGLPTILPNV